MMPEHIDRLACAVHALRPDWAATSLRTFIAVNLAGKATLDASLALVWVALDPATRTPARVLESGPWWRASNPEPQMLTPTPPSAGADSCRICQRDPASCRRAAEVAGDPHEYQPHDRPTLRLVRQETTE